MKKAAILGVVSLFVIFISLFAAATVRADIYINSFPEDIVIQEGDPLDVPLFFACKSYEGKPVEFFIWREDLTTSNRVYLGQTGWVEFTEYAEMRPLGSLGYMIEYAFVLPRLFDNTSGMNSFNLGVCIDTSMSGQLTENADCSQRAVVIEERDDTQVCSGVTVSPASISKTLNRGQSATVQLSVKDSCGQSAVFDATASQSWIALTKQPGALSATLNTSALSIGNHSGAITVSSGGTSAQVNVSVKVESPGFVLTGGSCTPSSVSLWPSPVSISAASGEMETATVTVKNNCGSSLSYSASVANGSNWLSASPSGNGTLTLTANAAGMQAGSYTGTVQISAGGYSASSLTVALSVAGECTPTSAVLTPSSISQTVLSGQNASGVSVNVRDNCGASLNYTVNSVSATYTLTTGGSVTWITAPAANAQGTGTLGITFNTASLPTGSYSGSITVTPSTGGAKTIPVSLAVTSPDGSVQQVDNMSQTYFDLPGKGVKYFKYMSNVSSSQNLPLQIGLAPQYQQNGVNSDMIIKYAGPSCESGTPTMSDYELAKQYGNSRWSTTQQKWEPERVREDLYYSIGSATFEFVEIYGIPDNPKGCYYIMVVNTLSSPETYLRLTIGDADSRAQ